jgi:hypothetical protein
MNGLLLAKSHWSYFYSHYPASFLWPKPACFHPIVIVFGLWLMEVTLELRLPNDY